MTTEARTATMTFVVYYDDPSVEGWLRERMRLVTDKYPSRVIVLNGCERPATGEPVEASDLPDWNDVGVAGAEPSDVDASVTRLALADAPLVIAWLARLAEDERFAMLARRSATLIVSSSALWTDDSAIRDLAEFNREHPSVRVQDLAYLRLATWQEIIAEFFDDELMLPELFGIRHVEIAAGSDAEALYLVGWLAGQLQWKPCGADQFCNVNGEGIDFSIAREGPPRRIKSVKLVCGETEFAACVHDDDPEAIVCSVTGKLQRESRNMPVTKVDIASLVERAMLAREGDTVFPQTLVATETILQYRTPS